MLLRVINAGRRLWPFTSPGGIGARIFPAFQQRDYRWLWFNGLVVTLGRSVGILAQGWLVLELSDSPFWVGVAAAVRGVGQLATGIIGGVIADRLDRRLLIMAVQAVSAVLAVALGVLVLADVIEVWHVLVVAWMQGVVLAINMPARNAFTYDLVGPHALLNATAANFAAFNVSRIVGPALAGLLVAFLGVGAAYLVNAAFMVFAIPLLLLIRGRPRQMASRSSVLADFREGLRYAAGDQVVRSVLLMSVVTETFGFAYLHMMPVFARDVLDVGASGLGFLGTASGVGALLATVVVASLGDFRHKGWLLVGAAFGFGLAITLFSQSQWFALSLLLVALVGGSGTAYDAVMSTVLQTVSPEALRGRVMGLLVFTFGMNPIGGMLAGLGGTFLGVPLAIGICGTVVMVNAGRMVVLVPGIEAALGAEAAP